MSQLEPCLAAARRRRTLADRSARLVADEPGRLRLIVVLPSADAATFLLTCDEAAELAL